jgi:ATP-binding cassette subfamily B (MDR/TAP) protein 1
MLINDMIGNSTVLWKTRFWIRAGKALLVAAMLVGIYSVFFTTNRRALFLALNQQDGRHNKFNDVEVIYVVIFFASRASFALGQLNISYNSQTSLGNRRLPDSGRLVDSKKSHNGIHFCNVHFSYPTKPSVTALDRVAMFIEHGALTGMVGSSASSKSIISSLLMRLYDPTIGRVLIVGREMKNCNISGLRREVTNIS